MSAVARICDVFTIEVCPNCGNEEVIWAKGVTRCPDCGASIAPCSVCDTCNYATCSYGCDGSPDDLKIPVTMPDISTEIAEELYRHL